MVKDKRFEKVKAPGGYLTVQEYAKKYNKSIWTVQWMCRKGKLPYEKIGRVLFIENK